MAARDRVSHQRAARLALVAVACFGCSPSEGAAGPAGDASCVSDDDCLPVSACPAGPCVCVSATCLPSIPWPATFAVEITPAENDPNHLPFPIELAPPKLPASPTAPTFNVPSPVRVAASFRYPTSSPPPNQTNATLAVRPSIAGRPDIPFDGLSTSGGGVSWLLPGGVVGRPATIVLSPRSPDDQTSPVHAFTLPVDTTMSIDVSADLLVTISGRVLSAAGDVLPGGFAARAFANGAAVSNVPVLEDGNYVLLVSAAVAKAPEGLVVEVGPGSGSGDPTFTFNARSFSENTELATIKLPPYTSPQAFGLTVLGDMSSGPPVAGALVRLSSTLPDSDPTQASLGASHFVADASTDAAGFARLDLLPGTLATLRTYDVAIVPPPGSPYATTCFPQQLVGAGGQSATPVVLQPSRVLGRRPVFSGRVLDSTGRPVSNVLVTATPNPGVLDGCLRTGPSPGSTLTVDGRFSLPLDPGTYQLDYDPPPGAAVPRSTELDVAIDGDVQRDVTLPAGVVMNAFVIGPAAALVNATARIFERRCGASEDCFGPNRTPPWLRGQVQTGAKGALRAVVALPAPAAP